MLSKSISKSIPIDAIVVFLMVATALGVLFEFAGLPALAGEIFAGFLLGPPLANYVPFPEAMVLVGKLPRECHAYATDFMEFNSIITLTAAVLFRLDWFDSVASHGRNRG